MSDSSPSLWREFLGFLRSHAVWWLGPFLLVLIGLAWLIWLTGDSEPPPFIYPQD